MNLFVLRLCMAAALCSSVGAAHAQRQVIINGLRLNETQIAWLELRNCAPVPNGRYWLDLRTGAWGYPGWPRQGFVGDACAGPRPRHQPGLSERDMLYRPGEIINGR